MHLMELSMCMLMTYISLPVNLTYINIEVQLVVCMLNYLGRSVLMPAIYFEMH